MYALPRKDTIVVAPIPRPDFSVSGRCFGYPTTFTPLGDSTFGTVTQVKWDFGDGHTSTDSMPQHVFGKPGLFDVSLYVGNNGGCGTYFKSKVKIGGLDARFKTSTHGACVGEPVHFTNQTFADTAVRSYYWDFGDSTYEFVPSPTHTYTKKGLYRVRFIASDYRGCVDTMVIPQFAVGEPVQPGDPSIYRVTVNDDNKVQLEFTRHKDIDLANYIIYRGGPGGFKAVDSFSGANDTVYVDNTADAMQGSYCYRVQVRNLCGLAALTEQEHCSVNLLGKPAVNSSVLNWNAYTGWEVDKYQIFREDINKPGSYSLIATVEDDEFAFLDSQIVCYRTHKYRIKALKRGGVGYASWSNAVEVTPMYIPHVPANEIIRATVENNRDVRIEWTGRPDVRVKYYALEKSVDGVQYRKINNLFSAQTQSYTDGQADVTDHNYYYRARIIDSCGDVGPYSNIGRSILLMADTTSDLFPHLYWSRYIHWPEGVRYYDLELKGDDGAFSPIARVQASDTAFIDNLTNFNSLRHYCYRITAYRAGSASNPDSNSKIMSLSNEACVPARSLIFIPNAFTPNGDNINDVFMVKGMYIDKFSMQIFDRWGTRVFESDKLTEGWDGRYKNAVPLLDAYRYLIVAKGADGRYHYLSGWVTLMQ
jgi:gliding motility-associated-like protein